MEREKTDKKALTGSYKGNKEKECRGERKTGRRDGTQGMTAWRAPVIREEIRSLSKKLIPGVGQ